MKRGWPLFIVVTLFLAVGWLVPSPSAQAMKKSPKQSPPHQMPPMVEVLNPEGIVQIDPLEINRHPTTLEGKTVMLRWNGKHNGDRFLERVGQLLSENVKDLKLIKSWEVAPETVLAISGSQEKSMEHMKKLASFKPDLVIGSQAD